MKIKKAGGKPRQFLLITGIIFIAINLRPALAGVGPLIDDIKNATGLSNGLLGLLTTLPLIAFGLVSTLTPLFTRRFGIGRTLLGAMGLLAFGIGIRSLDNTFALFTGTILLGIAIAFGNVLLPSLTKRNFEDRSGFVTSLYSSFMAIGAALAAGTTVPLAYDAGLGWRGSLAVWALLAILAFFIWLPQVSRLTKSTERRSFSRALKSLGKSRLAWNIALFMGLQSLTFYVMLAWLPAILQDRGFSPAYAGWMLSLCQATGILGSMLVPLWAGRRKDQRKLVLFLLLLEFMALTGLLFPQLGHEAFWIGNIGFVLGGTFGLALLFLVLRSSGTEGATELSGMAQSVGYLLAATGPVVFGSIFDLTQNWTYALIFLLLVSVVKLIMGLGAARPGQVGS